VSRRLVCPSLVVLGLAGCVVEGIPVAGQDPDPAGPSARSGAELRVPVGGLGVKTEGKLSTNGLRLDMDAVSRLTTAPLGTYVSDHELAFDAGAFGGVEDTATGRELLRYAALCALDPGTVLRVGGDRYPGLYELAPEWSTASCDGDCQRWVSACLLAHANARDVHVPISLRGLHPALDTTAEIEDRFGFQEGGFYGNLFASPPELYACVGYGLVPPTSGQLDLSLAASESYLFERVCSVSTQCGIEQTGLCYLHQLQDYSTCAVDAGSRGAYADCHAEHYGEPLPRSSPTYPQVLTVYLE
jgi:hypothetical protein